MFKSKNKTCPKLPKIIYLKTRKEISAKEKLYTALAILER